MSIDRHGSVLIVFSFEMRLIISLGLVICADAIPRMN